MIKRNTGAFAKNKGEDCANARTKEAPISYLPDRYLPFAKKARRVRGKKRLLSCPATCLSYPCPPCAHSNPISYLVTFETGGGAPVPPPQVAGPGGRIVRPANPEKAGHIFAGWRRTADFSEDPWDFDRDAVTCNMTLFAQWALNPFTVSFETNGGEPAAPTQTIPYGEMVAQPAEPARSGHVFCGWYEAADFSGVPWRFSGNVVTGDTTLHARWLPFGMTPCAEAGGTPVP